MSIYGSLQNGELAKCTQCKQLKEKSDWFMRLKICDDCHFDNRKKLYTEVDKFDTRKDKTNAKGTHKA